jgi:hypothetical protein
MDMPANAGGGEGDISAGVINFKSNAKQRKQQRNKILKSQCSGILKKKIQKSVL